LRTSIEVPSDRLCSECQISSGSRRVAPKIFASGAREARPTFGPIETPAASCCWNMRWPMTTGTWARVDEDIALLDAEHAGHGVERGLRIAGDRRCRRRRRPAAAAARGQLGSALG
jgi:hypothetical protein